MSSAPPRNTNSYKGNVHKAFQEVTQSNKDFSGIAGNIVNYSLGGGDNY